MAKRLGELLVRENMITVDQLNKAIQEQKVSGGRLGANLTKMGFLKENQLVEFLSNQYGVNSIDLNNVEITDSVIKLIPLNVARKYQVIPIERMGSTLKVAMADPSNIFAIDDLKFLTGHNIEVLVASEEAIIQTIETRYSASSKSKKKNEQKLEIDVKDYTFTDDDFDSDGGIEDIFDSDSIDVDDFDELVSGAIDNVEVVEQQDDSDVLSTEVEAPIVKLVNGILIRAIKHGISDIHIEPYEKYFRIRYRLDGVLKKVMTLPLSIRNAVTSRIKIMSQLDIAERRLPQDGRIKLKLGKKKEVDFRVSVLPTLFGEKVVLRLLDKSSLQLDMTKLGFDELPLKEFKEAIKKPYGMVLVTGPTGSGKTTTLYSALAELNKETDNLMTAEDPVEFNLAGINQVQMHEDIGLNFAAALRSFLRQDPDIIMVGEIRDFETAEIGIKAALTGHLVLSTLHTNDAPSTVNRLLNMGIEPFLVASSVNLILAQRLARRICNECKEVTEVPEQALIDIGVSPDEVQGIVVNKGKGCPACGNTGYRGRVALYEVMTMYEELKELVLNGASTAELKREAIRMGMSTLRMAGVKKIKEGVTTIEEVVRVTAPD